MNKCVRNEITLVQFICIQASMVISVGFISIPRVLAEKAGTDGWMTLFACWVITTVSSLVVVQVMKKYPDGTLLDLLTHYFGKWAGRTGAVLLALYFFYFSYTCIVYAVLITKEWLLPQTPEYLIMILLLIPTYNVVRGGLRITGRFAETVLLLTLWIPLVYLLPLKNAHWLHLFPLFKKGWQPVIAAVPDTIYYFLGFAATFIFYPYLQNKRRAALGLTIANSLATLAYLLVTIVCFVYFSPNDIAKYSEPGIFALKTIEFKFVERIEMIFIVFYLIIFTMAWIPPMFIIVYCTSWLLGRSDHTNHLRALWLLLAVGTYFFMPTFPQSTKLNALLGQLGLGVEYVFPVCMLLYLWLYDRFRRRRNND